MMVRVVNSNLTRWNMERKDFEVFFFDECYKDSTPVHFHLDFYEAYFFRSGIVNYNIENQQFKLTPGDMLLIPPSIMHWPIIQDDSQPYERMFIWIKQTYLRQLSTQRTDLTACFDMQRYGYVLHLPPIELMRVSRLFDQLLEPGEQDEYGTDLRRKALVTLLMLRINDACANKQMTRKPAVEQSHRIQRVIAYVNENLVNGDLSLTSIADALHISDSALYKSFRRNMGINLHQYIIKRRMYAAHQLLTNGEFPYQVSVMIGYADYSSFFRAFRKEFGYSPSLASSSNPMV